MSPSRCTCLVSACCRRGSRREYEVRLRLEKRNAARTWAARGDSSGSSCKRPDSVRLACRLVLRSPCGTGVWASGLTASSKCASSPDAPLLGGPSDDMAPMPQPRCGVRPSERVLDATSDAQFWAPSRSCGADALLTATMVSTSLSVAVASPCRRVARRQPAPVTASASGASDTSSRRAAVLALGAGLLGVCSLAAKRTHSAAVRRQAGRLWISARQPPGATLRDGQLGTARLGRLRCTCAPGEVARNVVPPSAPPGARQTRLRRACGCLLTPPPCLPSPTSREAERRSRR